MEDTCLGNNVTSTLLQPRLHVNPVDLVFTIKVSLLFLEKATEDVRVKLVSLSFFILIIGLLEIVQSEVVIIHSAQGRIMTAWGPGLSNFKGAPMRSRDFKSREHK
jgi:hypothetical protein